MKIKKFYIKKNEVKKHVNTYFVIYTLLLNLVNIIIIDFILL